MWQKEKEKSSQIHFLFKKISLGKNLRHQKMRFNYLFVDATKRVKSDRKEKHSISSEVSKPTWLFYCFHMLTNLSNLCPDYYIWRVEEKKTSGKTVVAGIAFSKAWQGVGGHMAQWIAFSLHTQLARVWFSEFIIIFLLILLRFIVGTV